MSWYTVAWLFWIAFFLVVEGKALFNKQDGDTFSEFVWKLFKVQDSRPTWLVVIGRVFLGLFLLWLLLHLEFGWLTPSHPLPWRH